MLTDGCVYRALIAVAVAACAPKPPILPGATDISIASVAITGEHVDYHALYARLGAVAGHGFNAFRVAEDRQRITAFLYNLGYFDADVDDADVSADHTRVAWRVREGARYAIASVSIVGAPGDLVALVPFHAGDPIDLATYRTVRTALADRLRDDGYARAQAYSRTFIDRARKTVAWFYFVEPGPRTRIGAVTVAGNHRVPADAIARLGGLERGRRYSAADKRRAELALLDSGAFASVNVISDADDPGPPAMYDDGGVMAPEQIDAGGNFAPRTLPAELGVRVSVVEAPARQGRMELGVEADPSRVDAYAGARLWLRDLFGPLHHLVLEGTAGYGWFTGAADPVQGVYGSALAQYQHPGFVSRALELRLTGRWRDTLYPSALLREITVGPGLRATLAPGVFVDGEAVFRYGRQLGMPALDAASVAALELPRDADSRGAELVAGVTADRRNDRLEPTSGWLASLRASYSPGGPLGDHRWLQAVGDVRGFVPVGASGSLAARVTGGGVGLGDASGIPLGPRLLGGGVDGMRGFARDHLSPTACRAGSTMCDVLVGGRSLVEASVEARWLPQHGFVGTVLFADAGAAGAALNPFADGVAVAVGAGLRLRTWYLPIAFDVGYRLLDASHLGLAWDRVAGFVHVGEAF